MRQKIKTVLFAAVVSALAVAGLAIAQGDDGGDEVKRAPHANHHLVGPPHGGNLTYSETHLRRDGEDVTVRTDAGKVTAADADSISIERNDGETVEIPVDGDTRVLAGPRKHDADVEDIATGKKVIVVREGQSEAAELVAILPKHPMRMRLGAAPPHGDFHHSELPAPPPLGGGE
jgi:hypothetical protein